MACGTMVRTEVFISRDGLIASLFSPYDEQCSISSASEREQSLVECIHQIQFADLNFFVSQLVLCLSSLTWVHSRLCRAVDEVRW